MELADISRLADLLRPAGRFAEHMMVVADLARSDDDAIEEAVIAAWRLQSGTRDSG